MALPLDPLARWRDRLEVQMATSAFYVAHWATLGMAWSIRKRLASVMFPAATLWLSGICTLHAAALALRWSSPRAYLRWRRPISVACRLCGGGFGAAFLLLRLFFEGVHSAADGPHWLAHHWAYEGARHAALLLMASTVCPMCVWAATLLPLSWAVPLQLGSAAMVLHYNSLICSTAALSSARAQDLTRAFFGALDAVTFGVVPGGAVPPPSPAAQCCSLLAVMQLSAGLVVPLLTQAVIEARLFQQHQAERAAAGLPPEAGWQPGCYAYIADIAEAFDFNPGGALACAWVLAGLLWKVGVALSVHQTARAAAERGGGAAAAAAAALLPHGGPGAL